MKNKRGDKYYIMISLILGLIVLSLSLYFIFQEYFNEDVISQESCRQSVILRANLPEFNKGKITWASLKDDFPLKCKTQVMEITKDDIIDNRAGTIIGDAMVECWAIFGNGDAYIFPAPFLGSESYCTACARIRLSSEAKNYMITNQSVKIDIEDTLRNKVFSGTTYYSYLDGIGNSFPALNPASGREFDVSGDSFSVDPSDQEKFPYINRATGIGEGNPDYSKTTLPKYFNASYGDLLISFGTTTYSDQGGIGAYVPYLLYFQINQPEDPFVIAEKKMYIDGLVWKNKFLCQHWEGIPA
jgi:hypothetical protein